jgi:hypothetical protein
VELQPAGAGGGSAIAEHGAAKISAQTTQNAVSARRTEEAINRNSVEARTTPIADRAPADFHV